MYIINLHFIELWYFTLQRSPAVNQEIQNLKQMIENQNKQIKELTSKVTALEKAATSKGVVENDETLGHEEDQTGE